MTDFTPSPLQAQAIRDIRDWFENRTDEQPVFRVWGYAGTGKSTLTKHAIAELGLDTMTRAPDDAPDRPPAACSMEHLPEKRPS